MAPSNPACEYLSVRPGICSPPPACSCRSKPTTRHARTRGQSASVCTLAPVSSDTRHSRVRTRVSRQPRLTTHTRPHRLIKTKDTRQEEGKQDKTYALGMSTHTLVCTRSLRPAHLSGTTRQTWRLSQDCTPADGHLCETSIRHQPTPAHQEAASASKCKL